MTRPNRYRKDRALVRALELAGGVNRLATQLGLSKGAVSKWERVPYNWVLAVERLTRVSRHRLRPDVYPKDGK